MVKVLIKKLNPNTAVEALTPDFKYGWRGAKVEHVNSFTEDFKGTEIVRLEQNYRSTNIILDAANALIDNNKTFDKIKDKESLSSTQKNQLRAYEEKSPIINTEKIQSFINKVEYPISYFDFETFTDAVPIHDKQRSHMQMPFQYSLHIQNDINEKLNLNDNHYQFIMRLSKLLRE